ncbi:MAG: DUF6112 family protein [Actinomycetota bacterium]
MPFAAIVWLSGAVSGEALGAPVSATPDGKALPGQDRLQQLLNGLYAWALILCLAALVVAAVVWAWGSHSHHQGASYAGRRGVLIAALTALIIGAGPMLVNFFYLLGRG